MVEFSQRLKQLRKEKHLTQAQVAERIGVTASMVSSYETDIRLPSYEVLVKIATLFGVTVDYMLCREDKRFIDILITIFIFKLLIFWIQYSSLPSLGGN